MAIFFARCNKLSPQKVRCDEDVSSAVGDICLCFL